ncbi:MAG: V-type ATP synthase subunit F [Thermoplasmatota archaeon]|jgi:V/A-type H+-transporting ATPase subunit F
MKLAGFTDRDTAVGLRLAGIHEIYIEEGENLKEIWDQICKKKDIGILFITEKIAQDLGRSLKDFRIKNNIPIILEIPDKRGKIKGHVDFVSHLIKKAVGIEINK